MPLIHCNNCHHEWEGSVHSKCSWCGSDGYVLASTPMEKWIGKKRGRKKTTGKYETRGELIDNVCHFYHMGHGQGQVARITRVSHSTVQKILTKHYTQWMKKYTQEDA